MSEGVATQMKLEVATPRSVSFEHIEYLIVELRRTTVLLHPLSVTHRENSLLVI